jgi:AcrR family transcriptional regulator
VPKLWSQTIESHRRAVREAILATTASLVAQHGLAAVTMSQIAEEVAIGRATLYKYFPDVESILVAWHDDLVSRHHQHLRAIRDQAATARDRLEHVLQAYAQMVFQRPRYADLIAVVHGGEHVTRAEHHLRELVRDLIRDAKASGNIRNDVTPDELASYCVNALAAASSMPSKAAVRRLVAVTMDGLRPPR